MMYRADLFTVYGALKWGVWTPPSDIVVALLVNCFGIHERLEDRKKLRISGLFLFYIVAAYVHTYLLCSRVFFFTVTSVFF